MCQQSRVDDEKKNALDGITEYWQKKKNKQIAMLTNTWSKTEAKLTNFSTRTCRLLIIQNIQGINNYRNLNEPQHRFLSTQRRSQHQRQVPPFLRLLKSTLPFNI